MGNLLLVDLSAETVEKRPLSRADAERFIGAAGINAKLAYELIEGGCDPLGPGNALIYGVGPFAGTIVPGAARTVVSAKSPLTNYYGTSAAGHFGMMLKLAGYDHLAITGRARRPCYLRIFDDEVSIEDASHLWGKDVFQTTDAIWSDSPEAWVSCIGQAGENLVKHAVIINNKYSTYGSTGLGAVMGSKNLKAIVALGTGTIRMADQKGFFRLADRVYKELMKAPHIDKWRKLGTLIQFQSYADGADDDMARRGFDMKSWTGVYGDKLWKAPVTCPGCPVGCKARLEIDEGERKGLKMAISCPAGTVTGPYAMSMSDPLTDWAEVARCSELANRYGVSTFGTVHVFNWLIDLYERGIIDKTDTFGLELKKGDPATYQRLLYLVAHREGIGDTIADTYEEAFARIEKATNPVRPDERIYRGRSTAYESSWNVSDFGVVVDPRQSGPPNAYSSVTMMPGRSQKSLEEYARRLGASEDDVGACVTGGTDGYNVARLAKLVEIYNLVLYSVSSCQRPFISRVLDIETIAKLYCKATGIDVTAADLLESAERIITLQRMFNVREGLSRAVEMARPQYSSEAERRDLEKILTEYYEAHGWDPETGIPPVSRVAELGLQDIIN
jgi:aldehyde:ferredoxin oxidoreductase